MKKRKNSVSLKKDTNIGKLHNLQNLIKVFNHNNEVE
mgnify:CR=1 FL=1